MAVSLADGKPATGGLVLRRGRADADDVDEAVTHGPEPALDHDPEPDPEPEPVPADPPTTPTPVVPPNQPTGTMSGPMSGPPPTARGRRGRVGRSQTAIEGRFADVARPSALRRILSFVGLVVVVLVVAVAIAALLGGIVGAAAEILGNAIG